MPLTSISIHARTRLDAPPDVCMRGLGSWSFYLQGSSHCVFRGFMQFLSTTGFVTNSSPEEEIKQIPIRQDTHSTWPLTRSLHYVCTYVHYYGNFFFAAPLHLKASSHSHAQSKLLISGMPEKSLPHNISVSFAN
jgi:hypothetical protein